jgi:hypothetical protein
MIYWHVRLIIGLLFIATRHLWRDSSVDQGVEPAKGGFPRDPGEMRFAAPAPADSAILPVEG